MPTYNIVSFISYYVCRLKESGKSWLFQFGSTQIERLAFRDSFVMIGQRGLTRGTAIEKVTLHEAVKYSCQRRF